MGISSSWKSGGESWGGEGKDGIWSSSGSGNSGYGFLGLVGPSSNKSVSRSSTPNIGRTGDAGGEKEDTEDIINRVAVVLVINVYLGWDNFGFLSYEIECMCVLNCALMYKFHHTKLHALYVFHLFNS